MKIGDSMNNNTNNNEENHEKFNWLMLVLPIFFFVITH